MGGEDCRPEISGAFTGDISPEMLVDAGASLVILGHSERRRYHQETDALVAAKVEGALRAGLEPIVCVGEEEHEREAGRAIEVVGAQLRGSLPGALNGRAFAVAYEPVWAIGSGRTPSNDEIAEVHGAIRADLRRQFGEWGERIPILYGGSVNPANAASVLHVPDVGGALVGGASLRAADFHGSSRRSEPARPFARVREVSPARTAGKGSQQAGRRASKWPVSLGYRSTLASDS